MEIRYKRDLNSNYMILTSAETDREVYEVRMITILDIYDSLVADDRPYKPAKPKEDALRILEIMAKKEGKLDEELVGLFRESRCWDD